MEMDQTVANGHCGVCGLAAFQGNCFSSNRVRVRHCWRIALRRNSRSCKHKSNEPRGAKNTQLLAESNAGNYGSCSRLGCNAFCLWLSAVFSNGGAYGLQNHRYLGSVQHFHGYSIRHWFCEPRERPFGRTESKRQLSQDWLNRQSAPTARAQTRTRPPRAQAANARR